MSKIVVIDGLARSGTTLISSIIHTQNKSACYRGIFHEFMACKVGKWPLDYANFPLVNKDVSITNKKFIDIKNRLLSILNINTDLNLYYPELVKQTLNSIQSREQVDSISIQEWTDLLTNDIYNKLSDLDVLYQTIATRLDVDVLAFRWNQGLPYINNWLRNPDHYWISVLRNPMDRALSAKKAFGWTYDESIRATASYSQMFCQIQAIEQKNHHIIYFEDLIQNPEAVITELYSFLGIEISEINYALIQQSGKPYLVETSDMIDEGKQHTEGRMFSGFDINMLNKYKKSMTNNEIEKFEALLSRYSTLSRYI